MLLVQGGLLALLATASAVGAQQCRLSVANVGVSNNNGQSSAGHTSTRAATPASTGTSPTSTAVSTAPPFVYGNDKVRGVNLGGWFVLEPWITPSIFQNTGNDDIVDEFTFGQMQDFDTAQQVLQQHWATWYTADDFAAMREAGLNHVRIPLGYWSVPMNDSVDPYISGAWSYLLQALNWAKNNSLNVVLDLHGAPGSQNGYDNSGQRTSNPVWAVNPANVSRTIDILTFIVTEIGGMIDVIELLNEPAGFMSQAWADTIRQFWQDGYNAVRDAVGGNIKVMIGDAFLGVQSWTGFLDGPSAQGVLMDIHQYQIFNDQQLNFTDDEHISAACSLMSSLDPFDQSNLWTVMGEWSAANTDCAQWLNGRGVGARWDGSWFPATGTPVFGSCDGLTGNASTFSDDFKTFLRQYWEAQVDVGESVQGWIYWAWKTESADEWSYQKGLENGWIPQDPTERMYPGMCDSSTNKK